jgi:hypothetical protein
MRQSVLPGIVEVILRHGAYPNREDTGELLLGLDPGALLPDAVAHPFGELPCFEAVQLSDASRAEAFA